MSVEPRAPFQVGDWIVEPEINCLRRDDVERHIEPKVMKVLLALADHPNHVVTKEDLMAAVWPGTFVGDDVLTRCISVLRRITQDDASMPHFIQTVPKVGYRLLAPIEDVAPESRVLPNVPVEAIHETVPSLAPEAAVQDKPIPSPWQRPVFLATAAVAVFAVAAVLLARWIWAGAPRESVVRTLPFTSRDGEQI